jgi:putative ABC transport system permease protein
MNFEEALVIATRALRANKLRAVLTTLGIVIGVSAVIVLVGLGDGVKNGFNSSFGPMATQLTVSKVPGNVIGGQVRDLTDSDVEGLGDSAKTPDVASVTPVVTGSTQATYDQQKFQAAVTGSTADYLTAANQELRAGQMFTAEQERTKSRVVVLGPNVVTSLFDGNTDAAVGQQIRIGRANFTVLGVLASSGQNQDTVLVPLGAARSYLLGGSDTVNQIIIKAVSSTQVAAAQDEITKTLDERHRIKAPTQRDFKLTTSQSQLERVNTMLGFLTTFTVAIAAISLLVGGIGVANIMLVSVTERTREIGIRKAIGARRSAIMKQFLIESTVLAGLGGIVGIIVGVSITLIGAHIIPQVAPKFGAPVVNPTAIVVSFAFSLAIGVIAGGYPALRAARLRPIEALRYQ